MQRGVQLAQGEDVLALMQANVLRPAWQGKVRSVAEDKAGRMVVELKRRRRCRRRGRWVAENLTLSPGGDGETVRFPRKTGPEACCSPAAAPLWRTACLKSPARRCIWRARRNTGMNPAQRGAGFQNNRF